MVFVPVVRVATRLTVIVVVIVVVVVMVVMEVIVVGNDPQQTVAASGHLFGRWVPERQALLDLGRGRSAEIARRRRRRLGPLLVQNLGGHPLTGPVTVRGRVVADALYTAQRFGLWTACGRGRPCRRVLFLLAAARAIATTRLSLFRRVPADDLRSASATAFAVVVFVVFGPTSGRIVTFFTPRPQTPLQPALLPTRLVRVHVVGRRRFFGDDDVVVVFAIVVVVVVIVIVVAVAVVIVFVVVVDDGFDVVVVLVFFLLFLLLLLLLFCCDQRYNLCSFSRVIDETDFHFTSIIIAAIVL